MRRLAAELDFGMIEVTVWAGRITAGLVYAATGATLAQSGFSDNVEANAWLRTDYRKLGNCRCGPMIMSIFRIMNKPHWWPTWLGGTDD